MSTDSTALHRPMPRPTAQVEPYVEAMGAETAVTFLLAFGGAELAIAAVPTDRAEYVRLIGQDKAKALAAVADRLPLRVPLAKKWLANMLRWQGHSNAQIARTLRVSEVSVRRWYNGHGEP